MLNDRVRETSTTIGTGALTLLGAAPGFITFLSGFGSGGRCYYIIDFGTVWEIGIGTVTAGNLSRDTILSNSSGTFVALNLAAGTKSVYCDIPSKVLATQALLQRACSTTDETPPIGAGLTMDADRMLHVKAPVIVDTDGATITFDMTISNSHQVVLGGNRILAVKNVTSGQRFTIKLIQDATGSRTVTWFSSIRWAGATAPTLTITANKGDRFGFELMPDGSYDGFILGQNY